jgi:quercetin dioxygenase-like cupin family protein
MQVKRAMTVEAEPVEGVPGVTIRWLWAAKDAAPSFALRLIEVEPGAATPYHNHPYEHEIYVLGGRARLRGETQEYPLESGDTALVLPGEQHQVVNAGSDTLRFLCGIPLPRDPVSLRAQVSLYPLGQPSLAPAIDSAIDTWRRDGLEVEPGAMSTLIAGDDGILWAALRDAFAAAAAQGEAVMVITVSNACPWPPQDHKS